MCAVEGEARARLVCVRGCARHASAHRRPCTHPVHTHRAYPVHAYPVHTLGTGLKGCGESGGVGVGGGGKRD